MDHFEHNTARVEKPGCCVIGSQSRTETGGKDIARRTVRDFPKERDAWREVDRLGLLVRINEAQDTRIRFDALAEHYLNKDFGADAVRPKTERTILNTQHIVRAYLIPQWGKEIADDIKPLDIQRWLKSLHAERASHGRPISKFRGTMLRIYRVGALHELVTKNPVLPVETRSTTDYKAILVTPQQTLDIIRPCQPAAPYSRPHLRGDGPACFGAARAALGRRAMGRESKIAVTQALVSWKDGPTKTRKSKAMFLYTRPSRNY